MGVIIVEGVLFVALIAAGGTLFYWVLINFTSAGVKRRQTQNRMRLERVSELTCPIHGRRTEDQLVRLADGEQACPDCYKETLDV